MSAVKKECARSLYNASALLSHPEKLAFYSRTPSIFTIYLYDLNQAIKFCKVHHFADDTNL